ncbi:MAG: GDSL-type esterase/lipase family protein [Eubacterium sp.]
MGKIEILMIGDSLIEYGEWETLLGRAVINRGIGGDTTYGVLRRIKGSLKKHPQKIVLMVGINDIITGESIGTIAKQYEEILKKIEDEKQEIKVYTHQVLPCNPQKLFFVFDNGQAKALNSEILRLSQKYNAICIDLWDVLVEKGELIEKYTLDGVHLTEEAYKIWAEKLKLYLE